MKKNLLVTFFGLVLGIMMAEVILRLLPNRITKINFSLISEERIFTQSRTYKFRPNLTRVWVGLSQPVIWHFNELGYRERSIQIERPGNIFRIICVGDSITMGFGVEDYQAFPRRLENLLKPAVFNEDMTHFEVLNLGVQGYSTPDYLSVIKEDVLRMKPDLVILGFYTNDPSEAANLKANNRYIKLRAIPDILPYGVNKFLKAHSRLYLLFLSRYYSIVERFNVDFKHSADMENYEWSLAKKDLIEISSLLYENRVKFVLLGIPSSQAEIKKGTIDLKRFDFLKALPLMNNSHYFELFPGLVVYPNRKVLYLDDFDDHFSVLGNEYLAKLIANYLWEEGLVPKQPQ